MTRLKSLAPHLSVTLSLILSVHAVLVTRSPQQLKVTLTHLLGRAVQL